MTLISLSMGQLSLFSNMGSHVYSSATAVSQLKQWHKTFHFANHSPFDDFWQATVQNGLWETQTGSWQSPWDAWKRSLPKPTLLVSRCVRSPSQEASAAVSMFHRWWCLIYAAYFFVSNCICWKSWGSFPPVVGQISCCIGGIERKLRY